MTGIMGVTTVPLPAFWSSSKNEDDQLRRSPRKDNLCQNPRCLANNFDCGTPHPEPPIKRIKGSFKNVGPNSICPVSSNVTRIDSEISGGVKAHARYAGKYADCNAASSPRPMETYRGQNTHGRHAKKYAYCHVASSPRPMAKSRRESLSVYSHQGSAGKISDVCTKLSGINLEILTGISAKVPKRSPGITSEESTRLTRIDVNESIRSARPNCKELARTIGIDSIESTTSISSSSHAPSISTPRRSPSKPSKSALAPLSVRKESTSTGSSSPGCSQGTTQGTTQSLPTCRLSDSIDRSIADENLTPSFLRSGRMAPPNSERDDEDVPLVEELDWLKRSLTSPKFQRLPEDSSSTSFWSHLLPQLNGIPVGSFATSLWHPSLPTNMDPVTRLNLAPENLGQTSIHSLPVASPSISSSPPILPTDIDPVSRPLNIASNNDAPPSNLPAARLPATIPPEDTTNSIQGTPISCSSSSTINRLSDGQSGSGVHNGTSIIEQVKRRRTPALTKSRESDLSTRSSTITKISNAAQMCILEQRLEDEDQTSNSSNLNTVASDSPSESCSIEPSSTPRGAKPVSAFYNALFAPDCTLSGTKALEEQLHRQKRSADRKLRLVLEIAMLSAMVTILVVVFYPAVTRGLRSNFYGCCSCPAAPATAASRSPRQLYSQPKLSDGCAYRGRSLWNCLPEQQTKGSTVK